MCILFPITYKLKAYSGVLSKEVEATILTASTRNMTEIPRGQGGLIAGKLKRATAKAKQAPVAGILYHLVLPLCR
jgi:hypothetical protein